MKTIKNKLFLLLAIGAILVPNTVMATEPTPTPTATPESPETTPSPTPEVTPTPEATLNPQDSEAFLSELSIAGVKFNKTFEKERNVL